MYLNFMIFNQGNLDIKFNQKITQIGAIDLLEVRDVMSEEKFRQLIEQNHASVQNINVFLIEAETRKD
jgi:hypothetical protein